MELFGREGSEVFKKILSRGNRGREGVGGRGDRGSRVFLLKLGLRVAPKELDGSRNSFPGHI